MVVPHFTMTRFPKRHFAPIFSVAVLFMGAVILSTASSLTFALRDTKSPVFTGLHEVSYNRDVML
ncbi:MAG: hypothetical protein AAGK74_02740, partial [Chloroflexota bacterium]